MLEWCMYVVSRYSAFKTRLFRLVDLRLFLPFPPRSYFEVVIILTIVSKDYGRKSGIKEVSRGEIITTTQLLFVSFLLNDVNSFAAVAK